MSNATLLEVKNISKVYPNGIEALNAVGANGLKAVNVGGFKATDDRTYDGLRDVAKALNLDLTKLK